MTKEIRRNEVAKLAQKNQDPDLDSLTNQSETKTTPRNVDTNKTC